MDYLLTAFMGAFLAFSGFALFMTVTPPTCPVGQVPTLSSPALWACVNGQLHPIR